MKDFIQDPPALHNQYRDDRVLRSYLRRRLPPDVLAEIEPGLDLLGHRAATDILELGRLAEAQPPRHVPYDAWGRRIDEIVVSDAWRALDRIAAEEGIVATAYERQHGPWSRVHQVARLYLYHPSSAIYSCPLAMTDGAARALELHADPPLRDRALPHLTSRDPGTFWTSGQWMTERAGGSDVAGTETVARPDGAGWRLHGTKWFTSATTAQVAMTLARLPGAPEGSRGLSLFYVELRDESGHLRNIQVNRLKDKLGTRALPTAELTLDGTPAVLVGGTGHGVRKIASLFNVTRVYNAVCAVGYMRRGLALARDYAHRRRAFGRLLADHPLHLETLAALQVEFEGAFRLVFHVAELLGREETGEASAEERAMLRLLTPLAKLYTAKRAIACASEVLECFGGAGYVEDTGLPQLLRDAQVLAIWEGTTNVLSLDALRAIDKENAFEPLVEAVLRRAAEVREPSLGGPAAAISDGVERLAGWLRSAVAGGGPGLEAGARRFAIALSRVVIASLLLEDAGDGDPRAIELATRWAGGDLCRLEPAGALSLAVTRALALDEDVSLA